MTEPEAKEHLRLLTAAGTDPQLTDGELDHLLAVNRLMDSDNRLIDDANWEPTYDFNRAAAMGYEMKMARAVDHHQTSVGGRAISAQQVFEHCRDMAQMYRRRRTGTVTVGTTLPRQSCDL